MAKILDIAGWQSKKAALPNAELIAFVKQLLGWAESGTIQQLASVWVDADGIVGDGYSPGAHPDELYAVIGGLEICKATLLDEMRKGSQ